MAFPNKAEDTQILVLHILNRKACIRCTKKTWMRIFAAKSNNNHKLEIIQMSISGKVDKLCHIYTGEHTAMKINAPHKVMLDKKNTDTK